MKKAIIAIVAVALLGGGAAAGLAWAPRHALAGFRAAVDGGDGLAAMVDRQAVYDSLFDQLGAKLASEAQAAELDGADPAAQLLSTALGADLVGPIAEAMSTAEGLRAMLSTGRNPIEACAADIAGRTGGAQPGPSGPAAWGEARFSADGAEVDVSGPPPARPLHLRFRRQGLLRLQLVELRF